MGARGSIDQISTTKIWQKYTLLSGCKISYIFQFKPSHRKKGRHIQYLGARKIIFKFRSFIYFLCFIPIYSMVLDLNTVK